MVLFPSKFQLLFEKNLLASFNSRGLLYADVDSKA